MRTIFNYMVDIMDRGIANFNVRVTTVIQSQ